MDFFDKATRVAKNVGDNVVNSAKSVGTTIYNATKEQSELASLNVQLAAVERKLEADYCEIGKRYVEYIGVCETGAAFDVDDIIAKMQPNLEKKAELKTQICEKETQIKESNAQKAKKKAVEEYEVEKNKLEKALEMDIITKEEYEAKLAAAQKKLDNYEQLRKVKMQLEMDIISRKEYEAKVHEILK